jgi:hypothetical protein
MSTNESSNQPPQSPDSKGNHPEVFKVQIDKQIYETTDPTPTGLQLLVLAGKNPPNQFALYEKEKGAQPKRIAPNEHVDLRKPGVERFVTLPLDQTEGLGGRRQFTLPSEDMEWLGNCGHDFELVIEGNVLRVILYEYAVPHGYNVDKVTVNVRIESGYPDTQIDMAYFHPPLGRVDGRAIRALSSDNFDGRTWQRWSRHRTPANPWRPGIDNLATHFGLVDNWLARELGK